MTTTVDTQQLFNVTIRRTYTAAHRERFGHPEFNDYTHPEWGESAEQIVAKWAEIHECQSEYWLERFRDEVLLVVPVLPDELAERRADAARRYGSERCCDLAIVKPCVCRVSFSCPEHGGTCHGTHD